MEVRSWYRGAANQDGGYDRNLARRKYDLLRCPDWFLEEVMEAFGTLHFLPVHFEPEFDQIIEDPADKRPVFCVPPLSQAAKYLQKAAKEIKQFPDHTILFLITARTEAYSWHDHVFGQAALFLLKGPFRFIGHEKGLSAVLVAYGNISDEAIENLRGIASVILPEGCLTCTGGKSAQINNNEE